jgi:cellulose synthase/poly-beta-1,6-N-acetylglucosamine synthase-like glycosyltransferase
MLAAMISISIAVIFLLGYPLLIFILKKSRPRPWRSEKIFPYTSVIIPSHGSKLLGDKISNTTDQYPREKMQITVVYSGSDQSVLDELRSLQKEEVITLVEEKERSGKTNALNLGLRQATYEVCAITDSDSTLEKGALVNIVSPFADPEVGAVSGDLNYVGKGSSDRIHSLLFNRYKKTIKNWESEIDSCSYAPGELLAFRRELVDSLPGDVLVDDYYILLTIRQKGYRCVAAPEAKVYEEPPAQSAGTRERTRRVVSGTFFEASRFGDMMFNKKYGTFGLLIFPAYVFRLILLPVCVIFFLLFFLIGLVQIVATLPMTWIITSALIVICPIVVMRKPIRYFLAMLLGMIYGIVDYLRGRRPVVWKECK